MKSAQFFGIDQIIHADSATRPGPTCIRDVGVGAVRTEGWLGVQIAE